MKNLLLCLILSIAPVCNLCGQMLSAIVGNVQHVGVTNNVSIVSGHLGGDAGAGGNAATITFNFAGATVTSGNTILCGTFVFGGPTYSAGMMTKTSGTSSVGTIALDQVSGIGSASPDAIYRIPVTGTGTITLTFNPSGSFYMGMGCAEFTGVAASPLSTTNTVQGATPGTLHSTGSITTTDIGVMFYVASENPNNDFTRTWSDVIVSHVDTGGSTSTGIIQYKIINASPNTLQDCTGATPTLPGGACNTGGDAETWDIVYALYKST